MEPVSILIPLSPMIPLSPLVRRFRAPFACFAGKYCSFSVSSLARTGLCLCGDRVPVVRSYCLPVSALPRSDSRARVFDYDRLASLIVDEGTAVSYKLLETLAERLINRVLADTPATAVQIQVKKFGPPTSVSVDAVAIELTGRRS